MITKIEVILWGNLRIFSLSYLKKHFLAARHFIGREVYFRGC